MVEQREPPPGPRPDSPPSEPPSFPMASLLEAAEKLLDLCFLHFHKWPPDEAGQKFLGPQVMETLQGIHEHRCSYQGGILRLEPKYWEHKE